MLIALEDRNLPSTTVFSIPDAPNGSVVSAERIVSFGGDLYFTTTEDEIGRITPTGQITPDFALGGNDLAVGADGNLWTALGNTVERITPGGVVTDFAIPTPNAEAESITAGADGNLWFEETSTDTIGRINPTTGAITEFPLFQGAFYGATNYGGITAGPDGNVWFVSPIFDEIGKITPGGTVTEYPLPSNVPQPEQITAGPDGNVYFTQPTFNQGRVADQIGQITPTGQVTEFALPLNGGHLSFDSGITTGPDGNIDFNTTSGLARITPTGAVTENLSTPSTTATGTGGDGITVGPDGNIWLADIGQIEKVILGGTTPTPTPTPAPAAATTTALAANVSTAVFGQTEILTATVSSTAGTPQGTVTFFEGTTTLGSGTLNAAGQATLSVSLGVGSHSVTASFAATGAFAASTSTAVTETVNHASTTTTLSASANAVARGQSVVFTVNVAAIAPGAGTSTGTISFFDGTPLLGTAKVNSSGQAVLTLVTGTTVVRNGHRIVLLGQGTHQITASYSGDSNFAKSTSAALTLTVN